MKKYIVEITKRDLDDLYGKYGSVQERVLISKILKQVREQGYKLRITRGEQK